MPNCFDPNKSQINISTCATFIDNDVNEDLTTVPGIGPVAVEKLKNCPEQIETTYQLIGKFLMLRKKGMTDQEHCDAMYNWLKSIGINSNRSTIIYALGMKLAVSFPNLFGDDIFNIEDSAAETAKEE